MHQLITLEKTEKQITTALPLFWSELCPSFPFLLKIIKHKMLSRLNQCLRENKECMMQNFEEQAM